MTPKEQLAHHIKSCEQCSGPDDGCEEGQRLEELVLSGEGEQGEVDHPYFVVFADEKSDLPLASFVNEHWAREWRHKYIRTGDIRVEIRRLSGLSESERQELEMYASK